MTDAPIRATTRELYTKYVAYWAVNLAQAVGELHTETIAAYTRTRLKEVRGKTVKSELSALRRFCVWLVEVGELDELPEFPKVKSDGTPFAVRRRVRAPEYSPKEIEAVLAALPLVSKRWGWPIRARFVLAYETSLRPETLDKLRVPENYSPKRKAITLTDLDDKESFGREVPLSRRAQATLMSVCPSEGLIFGRHRYVDYVRPAAIQALGARGKIFTAQHFRSATITHMLDEGIPITAVQYMAGHKHTSTTARYVRPSLRAAAAAMRKRRA